MNSYLAVKPKKGEDMERSVKANTVFAKRLAGKLKELGYWDPTTRKPQVSRFCLENPYLPSYGVGGSRAKCRGRRPSLPTEAAGRRARRLALGMEKKRSIRSLGVLSAEWRYYVNRALLVVAHDDLSPYARWRPDGAACAR